MNNKASINTIVMLVMAVLMILVLAFGAAITFGAFKKPIDEVQGALSDIGQVGSENVSQTVQNVVNPWNVGFKSLNYMLGVAYAMSMIMVLGLALSFRGTGRPWLLGVFILFVVLLLVVSILLSNAYEDFYEGNDDLAVGLQEQTIISYLILYAPLFSMILIFIAGIIMFTGDPEGGLV